MCPAPAPESSGTWDMGEKGAVRQGACMPCNRSGTCPYQQRYLNSLPRSQSFSSGSSPRDRLGQRAWRRKPVRLRCARRKSGALSFRVTRGRGELLAAGLSLCMSVDGLCEAYHFGLSVTLCLCAREGRVAQGVWNLWRSLGLIWPRLPAR